MAKKRSTTTAKTSPRATWKGNLSFGLVTFPVEAFNALNRQRSDIHFHQLHTKCHSRIHYEKVCPVHGKVSNEEIVSGYEYEKGKYVEIAPEQLDALRTHEERTLTIDSFVKPEEIDPIYFDGRMYYLLPASKSSEEAYAVMVTAMERENCYGIGQVVFSGKDQLALVRSDQSVLQMAMLNYAAEIKPPGEMAHGLNKPAKMDRQLKLAQSLIRDLSETDFVFSDYKDAYREKVQKLIASKVKNDKIVIPKVKEPEPATISLMDALKKSVKHAQSSKLPAATKTRKAHTA